MSNSSLVSITVRSPNHSGTRCYKLERITPHCMVGQMTAKACGDLFAKSSREASSNYGIGKDGEIGLYVDEENLKKMGVPIPGFISKVLNTVDLDLKEEDVAEALKKMSEIEKEVDALKHAQKKE